MAIAAAALAVLAATISPSLAYPVIGGSPERLLVTGEQSGGEFALFETTGDGIDIVGPGLTLGRLRPVPALPLQPARI